MNFTANFIRLAMAILCFSASATWAQQSVSIGTTTINNNAVLYLEGNGSQGLIIPKTASPSAMAKVAGMIVYNTADNKVYYCDGANWSVISGAGAQTLTLTGNTLSISGGNNVSLASSPPANQRGQLLMWDGTKWTSTSSTLPSTAGQVLKWNGTVWEAGTDNTSAAPAVDNTSIGLNGSSQLEVRNLGIGTAKLQDGSVTDVKVGTGISGAKIVPNFGSQNIITTGSLSAAAATFTGNLTGTTSAFSGNVGIRGVSYTWPTTNAAGVLTNNGSGTLSWSPAGTVSSVGLSLPTIFTVSGSPVTGSGTLSAVLASQAAATFLAAPAGGAGVPTFRTIVSNDIPALDASKITTGTFPLTRIAGAGAGARAILGSDNNTVSWVTGSADQLLGTDGTGVLQFMPKSSLMFSTDNVVPKGSATGLIASQIYDNGTSVAIGGTAVLNGATKFQINTEAPAFAYGGMYMQTQSDGMPFYGYYNATGQSWTYMDGSDQNKWKMSYGMALTTGGLMGIGTDSPTERLDVAGNIKTNSNLILTDGSFTYTSNVVSSSYHVRYSGNSSLKINGFNTTLGEGFVGPGVRLTVGNSGDGSIAIANSWNLFSDIRLKQDIAQLDNAISYVKQLRGVRFTWKTSQTPDIGFIAQEVEKVFPELVKTHDDTGYKTVSYEKLVPVLVEAIKAQQQTIEDLKARIESLEKTKQDDAAMMKREIEEIKKLLSMEANASKKN